MKIGYFADGPWSHLALEKFIEDTSLEISFICARFDQPDPVLKEQANLQRIDFITHRNVNSQEFLDAIAHYECDLFVSLSFNQIFKKRLIHYPRFKIINCHAGKLPFYRGRNVLNWALINDEKEFGVTVHYVDQGIDTGDIILQRCYEISDEDNYKTLLERAYKACAEVLVEAVGKMKRGEIGSINQKSIHPTGFYCSRRKPGDEVLTWNQPSRDVFNFVRALCKPGPMAQSQINSECIKINRAELIAKAPNFKGIPGAVLDAGEDFLIIKTKDSMIRVTEWEYSGKIRIGDRML